MNILGAIIFVVAGISCFIWVKTLSGMFSRAFSKEFNRQFGSHTTERGWDNPDKPFNKFLYTGMVIFLGIFLLAVAFYTYNGTVYY